MKLVVLGLSLSSSWGNGHATTFRALLKSFARRGHQVLFLERDVPWYAGARDMREMPGVETVIYPDWDAARATARARGAGRRVRQNCPGRRRDGRIRRGCQRR